MSGREHALVAGIVLAAGMSTRLGRPKQLLPLGDHLLIWWTVRRALDAGLADLLVVVGQESAAIRAALDSLPVHIIKNRDYASGQASSLRAGMAALADDIAAVVMLLGDQPEIDPVAIRAVVAQWRETGAPVVMTDYHDCRSHPILLARALFPELTAIEGDRGARDVIRRHGAEIATVACDATAPVDVDTESAYQALRARWPERS